MTCGMRIDPIGALPIVGISVQRSQQPPSFEVAMGSAADALADALSHADGLAEKVASGKASIAEAAIARAKADVMLEIAAVAASRVSGTITALLQTQV